MFRLLKAQILVFKIYFFTVEQPAIVVILTASVAGKFLFLLTTSSTTFLVISSKTVSITEPDCRAAGRP